MTWALAYLAAGAALAVLVDRHRGGGGLPPGRWREWFALVFLWPPMLLIAVAWAAVELRRRMVRRRGGGT